MIVLDRLSKSFRTGSGARTVLRNVSLTIPSGARVAVLGPNGAGKSTLLALVAGSQGASSGSIRVAGRVSWPMGFSGAFAPDMTGRQNARFVARIHGEPTARLESQVASFAELGAYFDMPVRTYSAGMRARLAFGLSTGIAFDWYLIDEITAVGDEAFRRKSADTFRRRLSSAGLLMVSHAMPALRDYCTSGLVLADGTAQWFPYLDDAIAAYAESSARSPADT